MSSESAAASGGGSDGRQSQSSIPQLLAKTYRMVDDPTLDHIISWNENGTALIVWQPAEFSRDVLPQHFSHNNFASFLRQLHLYGFRKVVRNRSEYAHDYFKRGEKELLKYIRRQKRSTGAATSSAAANVAAPPAEEANVAAPPAELAVHITPVNSDEEQIVSSNSSHGANATPPLVAQVQEILDENESLKRENAQLSQEVNRLRGLCGTVHRLMSSYSTNQCERPLPDGIPSDLTPAVEEEEGEMAVEEQRAFGVKRLKKGKKRISGGQEPFVRREAPPEPPVDRQNQNLSEGTGTGLELRL